MSPNPSTEIIKPSEDSFNNGDLVKKVKLDKTKKPEPLLTENPNRFVLFPITYPKIWEMYKKQ